MFEVLNQSEMAQMFAPVVGAAGGTFAIARIAEGIGMPRDQVAFASALVALTLAQNTNGAMKGALAGAAAAGVCFGIRDVLEQCRPKPAEDVVATPPDAVSRADLQKAVSELQDRLATQAREREAAELQQQNQVREMQEMVHGLLAQLKAANAEIGRLQTEAARRRQRDAAPRSRLTSMPVSEPAHPEPAPSPEPTEAVETPALSSNLELSAEELEEATQSVFALLNDTDREQLSTIMAGMTPEDARQLRSEFAKADPRAGAAWARAYLADVRSGS
jgi:hypothetical protein